MIQSKIQKISNFIKEKNKVMLNVLIKLNAVQIKFKLSMGTLTSDDEQPKTMKNKNEVRGKISERKKELNRVAATRYREKVHKSYML